MKNVIRGLLGPSFTEVVNAANALYVSVKTAAWARAYDHFQSLPRDKKVGQTAHSFACENWKAYATESEAKAMAYYKKIFNL